MFHKIHNKTLPLHNAPCKLHVLGFTGFGLCWALKVSLLLVLFVEQFDDWQVNIIKASNILALAGGAHGHYGQGQRNREAE